MTKSEIALVAKLAKKMAHRYANQRSSPTAGEDPVSVAKALNATGFALQCFIQDVYENAAEGGSARAGAARGAALDAVLAAVREELPEY